MFEGTRFIALSLSLPSKTCFWSARGSFFACPHHHGGASKSLGVYHCPVLRKSPAQKCAQCRWAGCWSELL